MFYLPLALLTWGVARWILDPRLLRSHAVYGLFGAVLATAHDRLVLFYRLWEYSDTGPISSHAEIALLISLSAAPVAAIRFAGGLRPGGSFPIARALRFTAVAMLPELIALRTGHILYDQWWSVMWSLIAYGPIWFSLWALHRWLSGPPYRPAAAEART